MLAVPFVFVNILNGLARYDERLDAAAKMLGAAPIQVLLRVRLPLMAPAIATAAGFAFLTSVDEYLVTSFLAGPGLETLPLHFWAAASFDVSPALAVVGTLLMALVTLVGFAVTQVRSRGGAHQPALVG
jgi:ABC-type spermidine/putrescine transport system permease subunit II